MRNFISLKFLTSKSSKSFFLHPTNSHFHTFSKIPIKTSNITSRSQLQSQPSSILSPYLQWRSSSIYGSLSKQFFSGAHFEGPTKNILNSRIGFIKTQLSKVKGSPLSSSQYRGWSSWSRGYSADGVLYGLIIANVAVFILWRELPQGFMYQNFTISVDNFKSGRIHTLITSAFSHIDREHLGSNMIGLLFFGSSIGSIFGPWYLLKLYVAGAVAGSIFFLVYQAYQASASKNQGTFFKNPSRTPGLGASGAVNAILLLDIFLFPRKTILYDFFIPVPAILLGIFLVGKDVMRMLEGDKQISGSAHMGGALVAALAWLRLRGKLRF